MLIYVGADMEEAEPVIANLPGYGASELEPENGLYLGGDAQVLVKQVDFCYPDEKEGSAFVVVNVRGVIPEVERLYMEVVAGIGADPDGGSADSLDLPGRDAPSWEDAGCGAED